MSNQRQTQFMRNISGLKFKLERSPRLTSPNNRAAWNEVIALLNDPDREAPLASFDELLQAVEPVLAGSYEYRNAPRDFITRAIRSDWLAPDESSHPHIRRDLLSTLHLRANPDV